MENIQDNTIFDLAIDEEGKSHISSIAQWANISAIVGFAGIGISIIGVVIGLMRVSENSAAAAGSGVFGLFISTAIALLLNITLINAAINLKKGIDQTDQGHFSLGLTKLAMYFKILGIITIIVLVIVTLILLVVALVGAGRSTF
ncbi:hypothetical protein [Ferruginibacter sp.]